MAFEELSLTNESLAVIEERSYFVNNRNLGLMSADEIKQYARETGYNWLVEWEEMKGAEEAATQLNQVNEKEEQ